MDLTAWTLYLFTAAALMAAAGLHYRRREPAGRGRWVLAALRGAALAVLVLLLFNPRMTLTQTKTSTVVALVDGSLSMTLPDSAGRTAWDAARDALDALDPHRILVFGEGAGRTVSALDDAAPDRLHSRLAPAVRAATEARADRVVVFTDGAIEDPLQARRVGAGGPELEIRRVGGPRAFNAGLTDVRAPGWVRTGDEVTLEATVGRVGGPGPDTLTISLRRDGRELARRRLASPARGEMATVRVPFTARGAQDSQPVRIDVTVTPGGSMPDDDRRTAYIDVADDPAGVALISLRPGQEARFLVPTLERALGLPVRAWLRAAEGRWLRVGTGPGVAREGAERPREAVGAAEMVVVLGLGADAPEWASAAATDAPRVLVFPTDGAPLPFEVGSAGAADWYLVGEVPSSPVAALLAGMETEGVPPLTALRIAAPPAGFWAPLLAREGRRGPVRPTLLAGRVDGRRVAVALGTGYWRWAFAGETARAVYDRYWSAVIGWLAEPAAPAGAEVRPVRREVPRGEAIRWRVPAGHDSADVRLTRVADEGRPGEPETSAAMAGLERTVAVDDGGIALPGVPPGRYRYTVTVESAAEGEVTVASYTRELTRPVVVGDTAGPTSAVASRSRAVRPMRGTVWPYLAVVLLLAAEWVLRRRWGLR